MTEEQVDADNEVISTERFIEEIRIQPAIWNLSSSDRNRMEKMEAWKKICYNLIPNFSNLNSKGKNKKGVELQKRWIGLRNCFNREKKNLKSGSAATARKEYQYYNQLSFLASMSNIRPKTNPPENVTQKSPMDTSEFLEHDVVTHENDILKKISDNIEKKKEVVNDHDQNFLNSLLPHFKKVPDEFKLDLQSEILYTLKKYVNYSRPNNNRNQYSQQYGHFENSPTTSAISQKIAASPADTKLSQDSDIKENMFTDPE